MNSLILLTPPASEPITLAEVKTHLPVDSSADDTLIAALITAARQSCEHHCGRALITQAWRCMLDQLPDDDLKLPLSPLIAVSAISSFDENGTESTFSAANYYADAATSRIILKSGAAWPSILRRVAAIKIDFTCGYGNASDVPAPLKQGMLQHIAQLYQNRGDEMTAHHIPASALALYLPYRILKVI